jgi:hypothetical protein
MNTELIMNSYISPVYITATNMVIPFVSISITSLQTNVAEFTNIALDFLQMIRNLGTICASTFYFIIKQFAIEVSNVMTNVDKVLFAFFIYNMIIFAYENYKLNNEVKNLKSEVEQLEKNISYFKKAERMREDWEQMWAEEVRHYHTEHNNKYKELNKAVKKLKKGDE